MSSSPGATRGAEPPGPPRFDRRLGALLGTFVGDALGMPFEGAAPLAAPEPLDLVAARLGRGTYTDDTQQAIALAEVLLAAGAADEERLAAAFLAAYEPARGYGAGTTRVLAYWRRGVPVGEAAGRVFSGGSFGNGAAMRVAPVGAHFAEDPPRLAAEAARSARLTHAHPLGVAGAVAQAAAVGAAVRDDDVLEAALAATEEPELRAALEGARRAAAERWPPDRVACELGASAQAVESVPAALCAATRAGSFEDACTFAVRIGGDADTIGAMAGAIAGARFGAAAIPARWRDGLEDGARGRSYVERLAADLWAPPPAGSLQDL